MIWNSTTTYQHVKPFGCWAQYVGTTLFFTLLNQLLNAYKWLCGNVVRVCINMSTCFQGRLCSSQLYCGGSTGDSIEVIGVEGAIINVRLIPIHWHCALFSNIFAIHHQFSILLGSSNLIYSLKLKIHRLFWDTKYWLFWHDNFLSLF